MQLDALHEVEDRYAIPDWTQERISIRRKYDVPLTVYSPTYVGELGVHEPSKGCSGRGTAPSTYLVVRLHFSLAQPLTYSNIAIIDSHGKPTLIQPETPA
jgi:hypothetical protein